VLTLYEHPLSAYAMKAKIALLEKGLEFQAIVPEGMASGTAGGAFVEPARAPRSPLIDGDVKVFVHHHPRIP
jgi:glutathione S-transferase